MANKRDLKKEINISLATIVEEVMIWEENNPQSKKDKGEKIIDEVIEVFDDLIAKVNQKDIESPKKHFNTIKKDLYDKEQELRDKIIALN